MKLLLPALLPSLLLPLTQVSGAQDHPRSAIGADNPHLHVRSGLATLRKRLEVDRKCHVAFLGGSITQNTSGHTAMVPAWLKKTFPDAEVTVTNAGLGSTCSTSGAFRLKPHIFGREQVDLLVVEFAVNDDQDAGHARRECIRGMEGIIRQAQRDHTHCGIVMVQYVNPGMLDKLKKGEVPVAIAAHEDVAARHKVISVNVAAEVAAATKEGRYRWQDYGGTHPGRFGYRVASNMIIAALESGLAKGKVASQAKPAAGRPDGTNNRQAKPVRHNATQACLAKRGSGNVIAPHQARNRGQGQRKKIRLGKRMGGDTETIISPRTLSTPHRSRSR